MFNRRRLQRLSLVLATLSLVVTLAACGGENTPSQDDQTNPNTSDSTKGDETNPGSDINFNKEGLPIVDEPVTITVLTTRWGSMGDSFAQNQWLIDLENDTNVVPEWQVQSLNDWGEQKAIMLNSQELPEVILGSQTFSDNDILSNLEFFLDLTDLIDEYMPNLSQAFVDVPQMKNDSTFTDGKIYSLPRKLPARPIACNQPIINKVWLDNLNLEVPTTIDELTEVLRAFKEMDANGNGDPDDEFPISGAKGLNMNYLHPFGITDLNGKKMMVNEDGTLSYYPILDSYKEGLKWLHQLYQEGIIDPESFTQDNTMQDGKRKNEAVSLVGFDYAWSHDALFGKWSDEYIAIAPIAGSDGNTYADGDFNGVSSIVRNELLITNTSEHPEIVARWADQFYTGEASIQNFWGAIDTVISANADGTFSLNDPPEGTSADAWYWDQSLRDFGPKYVSESFQDLIVLSPDSGDGLKMEISKLGEEFVTTPYPNVMFTNDEVEQLTIYTTDIDKYIDITRAEWITNGGIDEGWDDYISQLNEMGLEDLISIYEDAYERYTSVE